MKDDALRKADQVVERAAQRLQEFVAQAAGEGGLKAQLAEQLGGDADFLRRLKPSLIAARLRGEAPTDETPTGAPASTRALPAARPLLRGDDGAPNPLTVVGGALALGILLAKVIDWRSHAHPRP